MIDEIKWLGKTVTVTVDRPLGSSHPNYPDSIYTLNYGYIAGVIAPDGEELDAYVYGVYEPVDSFTGVVIAVIERLNDVENKLVVAPFGTVTTEHDIYEVAGFQEKYFNIRIIMNELF